MTFDGRSATSLVMLGLFVAACLLALGLPEKARFMPLLIGIPGALLCLWQFIADLRRPRAQRGTGKGGATADADDEDAGRSEAEIFLWLGLFSAAIIGFGFILGGTLVVIAFIRFSSRDRWRNALFGGAGTFAVLYGVFIWLLELSLFQGLVLEALF